MSEPIDPIHDGGDAPEIEAPPRRAASATFTPQRDREAQALSFDPAQQSLAEALRITSFILQLGIGVLIVLFLLSGAKQVRESERGVRLTFGAVREQDVPPGLHIGWPYPIGEFVTVQTGQETLDLRDSFFPQLTGNQRAMSLDQLGSVARMGLAPGRDGSVITSDGNIVHVRPTVVFRRQRPGDYVRNVFPGTEEQLVRTSVERAVTNVFASLTLDQALKQGAATPVAARAQTEGVDEVHFEGDGHDHSEDEDLAAAPVETVIVDSVAGPSSTIATRVRTLAQAALDQIESGIVIEEVALRDITPPLSIRNSFAQVQSAQSDAEQKREQADRQRRERLSQVAGQAADLILRQIDEYEQAIELEDPDADAILARIDRLLQGEAVEIDGERYVAMISGEATNLINGARRYRTEIESQYRSFAQTFAAKLEQYRTNPGLLITREWTEALTQFFARPEVEITFLPPGAIAELLINRDPSIARERERLRNLQQLTGTLDERERLFQRMQEVRDRQREIAEE
jgi:regulator of protease activity HflC (stomatin/prohibitin superfamily)